MLAVMAGLDQGKSFEEVNDIIDEQNHSGGSYYSLMNVVARFSKKGPEFYRASKKTLNENEEEFLSEIEAENAKFAKQLASSKTIK